MADERERSASAEERRLLAGRGAPAGLCATCVHLRVAVSRRSVFARCGLAETDPRFPRYPALPVVACPGYKEETQNVPDP
jgi:hypothetical protein